MAQTTPNLKAATAFGGTTYKVVTAATHVVASFPTRANTGYFLEVIVLAVAVDNYDEVNAYKFSGVFRNDAGTLALVGSVDTDFSAEDHAGWSATLAANGTDVDVQFVADDTTPVEIRVYPLVMLELGARMPHRFGSADNNPV